MSVKKKGVALFGFQSRLCKRSLCRLCVWPALRVMVTEGPHLFLTAIHRCIFLFHGRITALICGEGCSCRAVVILLRFRGVEPTQTIPTLAREKRRARKPDTYLASPAGTRSGTRGVFLLCSSVESCITITLTTIRPSPTHWRAVRIRPSRKKASSAVMTGSRV
jgi:hypothetical protein